MELELILQLCDLSYTGLLHSDKKAKNIFHFQSLAHLRKTIVKLTMEAIRYNFLIKIFP